MKRGIFCFITICLFFWAGCGDDSNDNGTGGNVTPTVTSMTPNEVSRGQANIAGQITGTNLSGATSVNLGDGITVQSLNAVSSTQVDVQFTVAVAAAAGARTITVTTARGTGSSSTSLNVSSNHAPTPKFTISPESGAKNTTFVFDASGSIDATDTTVVRTYNWNFGDNKSANGRIAQHKYNSAGNFTVTLTVTDNSGASNTSSKSIDVATGFSPVARYTVTPPSGDVGTLFNFNGNGSSDQDGTIQNYAWNFDDGAKASGAQATHKFTKSGVFGVTLTVTDSDGLQSVTDKDIRVQAFNEEQAKEEIRKLLERFFRRFAEQETLSAEVIVEGWSLDPDCPGREREIRIIETEQATLKSTDNEITEPIDVLIKPSHVDANATVTAHFEFTENDGTHGSGDALHEFTLVFQDGEWQVCNFKVTELNASLKALFGVE